MLNMEGEKKMEAISYLFKLVKGVMSMLKEFLDCIVEFGEKK